MTPLPSTPSVARDRGSTGARMVAALTQSPVAPSSWLAVLLLGAFVLGAWFWGRELARSEDVELSAQTDAAAGAIVTLLDAQVAEHGRALTRFTAPWAIHGAPSLEEWSFASATMRSIVGFDALGWFPNARVAAYTAGDWDRTAAERIMAELAGAAESPSRFLVRGEGGTVWYAVPVPRAGAARGFVLGAVSVDSLLASVPRSLPRDFSATVSVGNSELQVSDVPHVPTAAEWEAQRTIGVPGASWVLRVRPLESRVQTVRTAQPVLVFVVGVLIGLLCAALVRAMQMERTAAARARRATAKLRASEAEVRSLNAGLEERVAQRTAELERSNRDLEQFAYAASHDLQEPLRMVVSYLQLIERRYADALDDRGRQFVHFAVDGGLRMRELVRGLLHYSRVGRGKVIPTEVSLSAVFADVTANLSVALTERTAKLDVAPLPTVAGDYELLVQLFQNLVANSLKYSESDPVVRVTSERVAEGFAIAVEDEGIGVPPEAAERVFELFQRLHGRDVYEGTGLGLAVCKRIAELHGGSIHLDATYVSPSGSGARFVVTLPTRAAAQVGPMASRSARWRAAQSG